MIYQVDTATENIELHGDAAADDVRVLMLQLPGYKVLFGGRDITTALENHRLQPRMEVVHRRVVANEATA